MSTLYLIDAITCVVPIWASSGSRRCRRRVGRRASAGWGFAAVLDGFRYLAGNKVVLMSFVVDLIAMIFGMPRALFPQMAHESFGGPVEGGTTMACWRRRCRWARLPAACSPAGCRGSTARVWPWSSRIVVWGVAMVGFGVAGGCAGGHAGTLLWMALAFLGVRRRGGHGVGGVPVDDSAQAASDEVRGRLQGVFTVVVAGGPRWPMRCTARPRRSSAPRWPRPAAVYSSLSAW